jgi:hypothetical protein
VSNYTVDMMQSAVEQAAREAATRARVEERQRIVNVLMFEAHQHTDPAATEAIHEAIRVVLDPAPDLIL